MVQDSWKVLSKVEDSRENRARCPCPLCPSYSNCGGEILYCGIGPSKSDVEIQGCVCNKCDIYIEKGLKGNYYCTKDVVGRNSNFMRKKGSYEDPESYNKMVNIKDECSTGRSMVGSMGSAKKLPVSFEDIHFIPAQVNKIPLNLEEAVNTTICIGPSSMKPLQLSSPIIISGMSFGAVSMNVKLVIAETASKLNVGFNSGEGGITKAELEMAPSQMMVQYATGRFGVDEEILKNAVAVEIRFGQGAYPGKGSYLPAEKMNQEIAELRGLEPDESAYSPAHHSDILNPGDVVEKVSWLRKLTNGAPVGAKIGCGDIEGDIEVLVDADVDFVTLDGFGGGTGATDLYVRENVGIPIIAALPRAYKYLDELGVKDGVSILAGGGLRSSADFAKCLALGADAVSIGTAALIALNCEQYRVCYSGSCPTGVATQNTELIKQLNVSDGVKKLENFLKISTKEVANLTRITGKEKISDLNMDDLTAITRETAFVTGVKYINGQCLR
ncbi:glutamate synthase-related protein [Methanobacterium aggregans]|uniref:glutamate synthase-related protein n=1 Tax=Methanobacterium aggregans TaxID=1615586 RepID=UPI001AE6931C|nr:glutamate synthase-related protein [Methanobacterium aggregans]MBP2045394.1 glutamate synthase domain-containing protein 2 [Methanobacterium aggregans]